MEDDTLRRRNLRSNGTSNPSKQDDDEVKSSNKGKGKATGANGQNRAGSGLLEARRQLREKMKSPLIGPIIESINMDSLREHIAKGVEVKYVQLLVSG